MKEKVLSAYAEDYGVATMQDLINLTFSMKGLSLLTDFSDARQVGERLYLDEFLGISEEEKAQTNFIEFAEKTFISSGFRYSHRGIRQWLQFIRMVTMAVRICTFTWLSIPSESMPESRAGGMISLASGSRAVSTKALGR